MSPRRTVAPLALALFALVAAARPSHGQQPFITDDAAVTSRGVLHIEFSNEVDWLPTSALPARKQSITAGTHPQYPVGLGDISVAAKYNLRRSQADRRGPAVTVGAALGLPSGDRNRGLGSALVDYVVNGVFEWTLTQATTLRVNTGIVLSGNTAVGATGIKQRGVVFAPAGSIVRAFTPRLSLGAEVTTAVSRRFELEDGQLRVQAGGNYQLAACCTLDFGVLGDDSWQARRPPFWLDSRLT